MQRKDPKINYREVAEIAKLYDYYELKLEKIQVYIQDHAKGPQPQQKYIRDLSIQLRLYNCLEPLHPNVPVLKIGGILNRVDIVLTDYNAVYVLKILGGLQKEQGQFATHMVTLKQAAVQKLVEEHGAKVAGEIAAEKVAESTPPEAKIEEKKAP